MLWRKTRAVRWQETTGAVGPAILAIYAALFCMQIARSMFVVLMSWQTLQTTGSVASVGMVFICWQLVALAAGPFVGPCIDQFQRRTLLATGETTHGAGVLLLALTAFVHAPEQVPIGFLFLTASVASLGSLLSYPSTHALMQRALQGSVMRTVAASLIFVQFGNITGAAAAGACLSLGGTAVSLALCAMSSFVAAFCACLLRREKSGAQQARRLRHLREMVVGIAASFGNPRLRPAACALVLAYISAHACNALLAGFAQFELKLSADSYGWIAALYSGGGIAASVLLLWLSDRFRETVLIAIGCVLLAAATAALSASQSLAQAMLCQALIGLSFTMVRSGSDATMLRTVRNRVVGRVRSNIDAAIGLTAIMVYLIPSLLPAADTRQIFLGLACLLAAGSCAVLSLQWRVSARATRRHKPGGVGCLATKDVCQRKERFL